jgi:hypothetical protein
VSSTVPTWLALASTLFAQVFTQVVTVAVAYLTTRATNKREQMVQERRTMNEKEMLEAQLAHQRLVEQYRDRLQAYRTLARLTRNIEERPEEPPDSKDLAEAFAEIELLTDSAELLEVAENLTRATDRARDVAYEFYKRYDHPEGASEDERKEVAEAIEQLFLYRDHFIESARSELGQPPIRPETGQVGFSTQEER